MNSNQLETAQYVTGKYWLEQKLGFGFDNLTFEKISETEDSVLLFGSNAYTKHWSNRLVCVSLSIGKRGGVKIVNKRSHYWATSH